MQGANGIETDVQRTKDGVYDSSSDDYINDIKSVVDYYIYDFLEILELKK